MKSRKLIALYMASVMLGGALTGCSSATTGTSTATDAAAESTTLAEGLDLSSYASQWAYNETYDVYYLENVVYVANPVDTTYQSMNIYVPAAYMNEDGTIKADGTMTNSNGVTYTTETAPIVYNNGVWGYSQATAAAIDDTTAQYVESGYIYVSVGSRGKETVNADGTYVGKAPEGLVDLKAGVRFLKGNDTVLAGSSDRIISVGLSAGGGMSTLLGSTGNSDAYTPYLEEIGAVMTETDDVYGAMAYSPITNLENSDMTYEWMFVSDTTYSGDLGVNRMNGNADGADAAAGNKGAAAAGDDSQNQLSEEERAQYRAQAGANGNQAAGGKGAAGDTTETEETEFTEFQAQLSKDLAALYPDYVNSLNLGITLGEDGRSGTYYEGLMQAISDSLNTYLSNNYSTSDEKAEYIATLNESAEWVKWDAESETATIDDLDALVQNYLGRAKSVLGFDAVDLSAQENLLFGDETTQLSHFSVSVADLLASKNYSSLEGYEEEAIASYEGVSSDEELQTEVSLMNPLNYIGTEEESTIAPYFRILVGTQDADSAYATGFTLATALEQQGVNVDFEMLWGQGHRIVESNGELGLWIDEICK